MKLRHLASLVATGLMWLSGTVWAAPDLWVAPLPQGSNTSGDGTQNNPYATISFAYTKVTAPGQTIRVKPGEYFDKVYTTGHTIEVSPGVFVDKWVNVIANDPNPTHTSIIGDFLNPVVKFGGAGGTLQGFTITGGKQSAVIVIGNATIANNIINDNDGADGAGLRVNSDTCLYGPSVVQLLNNSVTNNTATNDGGGIFISAGLSLTNCQSGSVSVLVEGNTITGNTANDDGGGIVVQIDTFPNYEQASVTVRNNVIDGNSSGDEGGGGRFIAGGTGTANLLVVGNTFHLNTADGDGAGFAGRVEMFEDGNHHMLVDGNTVTNNTSFGDGGGMLVKVEAGSLFSGQSYSLVVSNNFISANSASGFLRGGGGILARYEMTESNEAAAVLGDFRITGNTISYNTSELRGGGISAYVLTNREGAGCVISGPPAAAVLHVENNLIIRNTTTGGGHVGAGVFTSVESCLNSTSRAEFVLNTIAKNTTASGGAGLHIETMTSTGGQTQVLLGDSIVWDNPGGAGVGGPVPTGPILVDVEHSDVFNNSPNYATWVGNRTGLQGNISVNPLFTNPNADNFHLNTGSPAIETGNRAIGDAPPTDWEGTPRVVDANKDGLHVVDMGADEFFICDDADLDGYGATVTQASHCTLDNCPAVYNPGQWDCDDDGLGDPCDPGTTDADNDGVAAACDLDDTDPFTCGDLDGDLCDDCTSGVAYLSNDGPDFDFDGLCDVGDPDDDSDGAPDAIDEFPLNPAQCGDADGDTCFDDCPGGVYQPLNDGPDFDADGQCDAGDPDDDNDGVADAQDSSPLNSHLCADLDHDGCDDCTSGAYDPLNDGPDADGDGRCAVGDSNDANPTQCADWDQDLCDDCSSGTWAPGNDGSDIDGDGQCDLSDPDDDGDSVPDATDCAPQVTGVSAPPGEVGPTLRLGPEKERFRWIDIANAQVFNLYRGVVPAETPFGYDHVCHVAELPGVTALIPPGSPETGALFYYLLSGKNTCGEGMLGQNSGGQVLSNPAPCGSPGNDTDGDSILDINDDCPLVPNPTQKDSDADTTGDACDNCVTASNVTQADFDGDGLGDACDLCTDTDGDGNGDAGFPANTCPLDNCPAIPNPGQFDGDGDGLGNVCDVCPNDPLNDEDGDGACHAVDNCPTVPNPNQKDADADGAGDFCDTCTDTDGDGLGNPGYPENQCPPDNCTHIPNPSQDDQDGDFVGDVCDTCTDSDHDGYGDPEHGVNTCPVDNCPSVSNPTQLDTDGDDFGDACDPCFANPDPSCVACPSGTDMEGDGICQVEVVLVEEGSGTQYLANPLQPAVLAIDWVAEGYVVDESWQSGPYGLGYDDEVDPPNALGLIATTVPSGSASVYSRASIEVADPGQAQRLRFGADYDDGIVAWLNGVEIFRSPEMPAGDPAWDTVAAPHESSNLPAPLYDPIVDVTAAGLPALHAGTNVLAVGVWNAGPSSGDLVLVPRLSMLTEVDNCPGTANPNQVDSDGDGLGDACDSCRDVDGDGFGDPNAPESTCPPDNCPLIANPGQEDEDQDGVGDACDPCISDPGNPDIDVDGVCTPDDNCPFDPNPLQEDDDLDGVGNVCDSCPQDANPSQSDIDLDEIGDACDPCVDPDGDGTGDPDFPATTCPIDNCPALSNPDQADADLDEIGDACDPCVHNPNTACVQCPTPAYTDPDSDGICDAETVLIQEGSAMAYRTNGADPGIPGIDWVATGYVPDGNWQNGMYGVGYDTSFPPTPNCHDLISTPVPVNTKSIYTRADFSVASLTGVKYVVQGADYDDGYIVWINGVEVFRSSNMPAGVPPWNANPAPQKEPSNAADPVYDPVTNVASTALPALHTGSNVAAIGVWNSGVNSSDLLLVPRLSLVKFADNCPNVPNSDQADGDNDGVGTVCDNCPSTPNPGQSDGDNDGIGGACDTCTDSDGDGYGNPGFPANTCPLDNCPTIPNPGQEDNDGDGKGDVCDPTP